MPLAQAQSDGALDVPFVTTPQNVVDAMLALAEVGPNDRLLDLGSGDGRLVITAARCCTGAMASARDPGGAKQDPCQLRDGAG
jgi:precorrin-6B methylase 2